MGVIIRLKIIIFRRQVWAKIMLWGKSMQLRIKRTVIINTNSKIILKLHLCYKIAFLLQKHVVMLQTDLQRLKVLRIYKNQRIRARRRVRVSLGVPLEEEIQLRVAGCKWKERRKFMINMSSRSKIWRNKSLAHFCRRTWLRISQFRGKLAMKNPSRSKQAVLLNQHNRNSSSSLYHHRLLL